METFAVLWSGSGHALHVGKLELEATALWFGGGKTLRVLYSDIENVHVARDRKTRIAGRPALVLDLVGGGSVRIASFGGLGALSELAERLSHLTATEVRSALALE
jgi:hypothetical protein